MLGTLAIFFTSIILMLVLVAILVKASIELGKVFGIGKFSLAFILMSFATSIPEILIAFVASANGYGDIGIGIVIGSNIVNLTLITGLIALLSRNIETTNMYRNRQAILLIFMSAVSIITLVDGSLTSTEGLLLIVMYFLYLFELWFSQAREAENPVKLHYSKFLSTVTIIILTIMSVVLVSEIVVENTIDLSSNLSIDPMVLAAILISFTVAAPELFFEYRNVKLGDKRLALGDLIGAVGTNTSLVIGIIALIDPISFTTNNVFYMMLFFYAVSIILFVSFIYTRKKLEAKEGALLVFVYIAFLLGIFLAALSQI